MNLQINPRLQQVCAPPIADAHAWVAGKTFSTDKPLLDVSQAVPSYPPAYELRQHLTQLALQEATALYTPIAGLPALRQALADELAIEYQGNIQAEHVAITAGCNEAFSVTMMALAQAGDEVLLPLPYYFNHQMWLQTLGVTIVPIPFNASNQGIPDMAQISARISKRTRALVLVTPNNPTGAIYPSAFIEQCFELSKKHGFALVIDETYKDFRADISAPPHTLFSRPDWAENFVHLYSFSKAYALTGYRVGSITASEQLLGQIAKLLDCITICPAHLSQCAALYGLQHLKNWRDEKRDVMHVRNSVLKDLFEEPINGFRLISSGAYFAYLAHPFTGQSSYHIARQLADEQHVLSLPGTMFGEGQEQFLRIAFANLDAEGIHVLGHRLRQFQATR